MMQAQSRFVVCLLSSFLLLSATPALAQGPPSWVADEILVGVRPGVARSQARAAYRAAGASLIKEIPQIGVHRLRVAPAALEAVERTLRARGDFAFVERNRRFPPTRVPARRLHPALPCLC